MKSKKKSTKTDAVGTKAAKKQFLLFIYDLKF